MINQETIKKAFQKAGLPIEKIRKSKLGGFYVYHPFGSKYTYKKYSVVEKGEGWVKKLRETKIVRLNFIDDYSLLELAIGEGKNRQKYS